MSFSTGFVAEGFEPVREAFERNFAEDLEHGAAFSVFRGDDKVVELYRGWRDRELTLLWDADTLSAMYSTTKPIMALVVAMLVDRGLLDYDRPVSGYWPEFGAEGKREFTLAQVLSHQCGIPGFLDPIDLELWFNHAAIASAIAKLKPMFRPGEGTGYHALTPGYVAAELALRVDGRTLGTILREDVCVPLAIDYHIGTPASEHGRIAEGLKPDGPPELGAINDTLRASFLMPWSMSGREQPEWKTSEIPSANGFGTATGTAHLMSTYALKGRIGERRLISESTWQALTRERVSGADRIQPGLIGFAAGLQRNTQPALFGPNPNTIGQTGWGGSAAFADPDAGVSAAYLMNRKGTHLFADHRRTRLIDGLYSCL